MTRTDDGVLQRRPVLEQEYCVRVTAFGLSSAGDAAAIGLHAAVENASDFLGCGKGLAALAGGDGK